MQLLGKLGLIFLLFQVGMEFDYSHLRAKSKTVTSVSIFGMVMPFLCGLAIAPWLHKNFAPETPWFGFELFLCVALSISALPIMGRILIEMNHARTALGAMTVSMAALMNTRALMGLIAINVGLELKLLTPALTMLVIMALLTTAMCGPLLRWWLPQDLKALVPRD
jgi:Kef-type K+ transport system membrane component KefB